MEDSKREVALESRISGFHCSCCRLECLPVSGMPDLSARRVEEVIPRALGAARVSHPYVYVHTCIHKDICLQGLRTYIVALQMLYKCIICEYTQPCVALLAEVAG